MPHFTFLVHLRFISFIFHDIIEIFDYFQNPQMKIFFIRNFEIFERKEFDQNLNSENSIKFCTSISVTFVEFVFIEKSRLKLDILQQIEISPICGFNVYLERYFFGILNCSKFNFQKLFRGGFLILLILFVCVKHL